MFKDKSPGLKILWIWTFGTAAVLVTSVMKTRIQDMEKFMYTEEQQQPQLKEQRLPVSPSDPTTFTDDVPKQDSS
ncbi:hypothetical protein MKX01_033564 [Papaver californicum]|nr:hypothetical protein MKX01_033564 [Papaver californicum]